MSSIKIDDEVEMVDGQYGGGDQLEEDKSMIDGMIDVGTLDEDYDKYRKL